MNEIRISGWDDLNHRLFEHSWNEDIQRFRPRYVFRGMGDARLELHTSLARLGGNAAELERHLLRNFKKYAFHEAVTHDSVWNWMAVAQHHGLPTRLLDWSFSPLIAAHFATCQLRHFHEDGVIWCVDFTQTNALLPGKLRGILDREGADMFSLEMMDEAAGSLEEFDGISDEDFVLFFEPPSMEGRIVNQYALFSLISNPASSLEGWLEAHPQMFVRIIIPAEVKWEVRDKLDLANINERLLFPGLDGLSRWLKRYYTPRVK